MTPADELELGVYFRSDGGMLGNLPSNFGAVAKRLAYGCLIDSSGDPHAEEDAMAHALDERRSVRGTYRRIVAIGPLHARILELVLGTAPRQVARPHAAARWGKLAPLVIAMAEDADALESACLRLALGTSTHLASDKALVIAAGKAGTEAYRQATAAWTSSSPGSSSASAQPGA